MITSILYSQGGYIDYFYEKFTTPKAKSMILGDSRSMQGLQPRVLNECNYINTTYQGDIQNYSFTIAQIAYGPEYFKSIKRKLDTTTTKGLFIVTVNPWLFSKREKDDFDTEVYFESDMPPHNMNYVDHRINFEYFIKNFDYFHFRSIIRRSSKLHRDGWLEESNLPKDEATLTAWKKNQIVMYQKFSKQWLPSDFRMQSFQNIIRYLKNFGTVILLRMPVDEQILTIENQFWTDFDKRIDEIADNNQVIYINLKSNDKYQTYDGNHIDKYGGVIFSQDICEMIKKITKQKVIYHD
ncbi:hypothetical protein ACE939_06215 [Aquimarina sp. W85]|uniref:hypothetical protein n=1 Tax=Aquimarina rhodophyticola TaxID=3342246 RepID=UPI003672411B